MTMHCATLDHGNKFTASQLEFILYYGGIGRNCIVKSVSAELGQLFIISNIHFESIFD